MSDGIDSFACFLYPSNEINWPPTDQPPNALAGFNYGNNIRYWTLPNVMTHAILNIEEHSNVHSNGKWLYHINPLRIHSPPCKYFL